MTSKGKVQRHLRGFQATKSDVRPALPDGDVVSENIAVGYPGCMGSGGAICTYYYLHDGLGSAMALVDSTGAVQNRYAYDPWGNAVASGATGSAPNPFQYVGVMLDTQTGLYRLGQARVGRLREGGSQACDHDRTERRGFGGGGRLYGALLGTGDVVDLAPSSQGTLGVSSPLTHKPWATSRIVDTIFSIRLRFDRDAHVMVNRDGYMIFHVLARGRALTTPLPAATT